MGRVYKGPWCMVSCERERIEQGNKNDIYVFTCKYLHTYILMKISYGTIIHIHLHNIIVIYILMR